LTVKNEAQQKLQEVSIPLNENSHNFMKFVDPALEMKGVLDATVSGDVNRFLTHHSISCTKAHHTPVAEECPWNPLGIWGGGGVQKTLILNRNMLV
jgi:hypothetical protein